MADNDVLSILLVGHSFIRRLANYALSTDSLNMGLSKGDCKITFVGRGGMTVPRLRGKAVQFLTSCRPDVIFLEIGTNDLSTADPLRLAADVFELAQWLVSRGVRRVVISQIFFRVIANGRRDVRVAADFNERVVAYNARMREHTLASADIEFWRHRGMWRNWENILIDGVHFTGEGNRRYFNSVRGALVGAVNRLT